MFLQSLKVALSCSSVHRCPCFCVTVSWWQHNQPRLAVPVQYGRAARLDKQACIPCFLCPLIMFFLWI